MDPATAILLVVGIIAAEKVLERVARDVRRVYLMWRKEVREAQDEEVR